MSKGVFSFLFYHKEYRYGLLSDCDSHLKGGDARKVVPVFLSVGCRRGCDFCYVSSSNYPFETATPEQVERTISYCLENDWNIHFCDENFLRNPQAELVHDLLRDKGMKYICLTDSLTLSKTLRERGEDWLLRSGNALNEVGLEGVDSAVTHKVQDITDVITESSVNTFWLTITLFPGDTLGQMNRLGEFLGKYGTAREKLLPRIQTNGTVAGLGQFCQIYDGTKQAEYAYKEGLQLEAYPTRLWPSYVGLRLLGSPVKVVRSLTQEDEGWADLYFSRGEGVKLFRDIIAEATSEHLSVGNICRGVGTKGIDKSRLVAIAQLARLGVITEG